MRHSRFTMLATFIMLCGCQSSTAPCPNSDKTVVAKPASNAVASRVTPRTVGRAKAIPQLLSEIYRRKEACISAAYSEIVWFTCDDNAIAEFNELVSASPAGKDLNRLFAMVSYPMERGMAGEDAVYAHKSASGSMVDLSRVRVIILTNVSAVGPYRPVGLPDPEPRLAWMSDQQLARKARRLWDSIRDRDCKAFPVPHCAERLNNAFSDLIDRTVVEERAARAGQI